MSTKMTPQLRFPEFTDEWQVKKLGDVVKLRKKKFDPQKSSESRKDIELDNLASETGGVLGYVDSRTQMSIKNVFQKSDVLYGKLRPYLKKFAKAPWDGVSSSEIWAMYSGDINSNYLLQLVQTKAFNDSVNIQSGSKMPRADWRLVSDTEYHLPSKPEQEKIADFLTAVDERIAVSEKKLELLETYKRGVMQKIFSQQIRFKDENGNEYPEWEKKNLGELVEVKTGNLNVDDANPKGKYHFFDRSIDIKRYDEYSFDNEALIYSGEGSEFLPRYFKGKYGLHQRAYTIFNPKNLYMKFLYYVMLTQNKHFLRTAVGTTVKSLRMDCFTKCTVPLPNGEEQQKIATFLTALDDKITAEKSKLTATRQFKKALLQRMFV